MSFGSYAFGTACFAGTVAGVTAPERPPVEHGLDVRIYIAGTERTGLLLNDSLRVSDELGIRNTCEFSLKDSTKSLIIQIGEVVRVTYNAILIFAGTIDTIDEVIAGDFSDVKIIRCICVDWNQLCDRHFVSARFSTENQTLKDVVEAIVEEQSGIVNECLTNEGVTTNGVQTGPALEVVAFNYEPASECFDQLAELVGYTWYVDYDKDLKFFDMATYYAPYQLDESQWRLFRGLRVRQSREKYRNIQYLRAGKAISNLRTEYFKGDGTVKTFTVALKLAEKPTLAINGVPVDPGNIDVRKDEKDLEDVEWFYDIDDKQITQNSSTDYVALTSAQTLSVTYRGFYPILVQSRNDYEISQRKAIEADYGVSTGVYEEIEIDENIDDAEMAQERVVGILRTYARIEKIVEFECDVPGFRAGQILEVKLPEFFIDAEFMITSVSFSYIGDTFFRYNISATEGGAMGSWADFWKRLARKGRPFAIAENETLNIIRQPVSGIIVSDRVSLADPLPDWTEDWTRYWQIGLSKIGGRRRTSVSANPCTGVVYGPMIGLPFRGVTGDWIGRANATVSALDATAATQINPLNFFGFEAGDGEETKAVWDNAEISSAQAYTGTYSARCYPSGATDGAVEFMGVDDWGICDDMWDIPTLYGKFMMRMASLPASLRCAIYGVFTTGSQVKMEVRVNSNGYLEVYDADDTLVSTGSTQLSVDTWYRIEVKCGTGTSGAYAVKINGNQEVSGTSNLSTVNVGAAWVGRHRYGNDADAQTMNAYYDDVSFDGLGYVGDTRVKMLVPDANGYYTGWTTGAGNKWEQIDEIPPNGDTDFIYSVTNNDVYTCDFTSCSEAGISGEIKAIKPIVWARKAVGGTVQCKIRVRSDTTDVDTVNALSLSESQYYGIMQYLNEDPATSASWTTGGVDAIECGPLKLNDTNEVRCTSAKVMVEYIP